MPKRVSIHCRICTSPPAQHDCPNIYKNYPSNICIDNNNNYKFKSNRNNRRINAEKTSENNTYLINRINSTTNNDTYLNNHKYMINSSNNIENKNNMKLYSKHWKKTIYIK